MLAVAHQIAQNDRDIRAGGWATGYSSQLYGKTLGVVGTGSVGQRMIQLGKAIGMKVVAWTLHSSSERAAEYGVEFVALKELMRQSDVVSIHVLGVPQTDKLIGNHELALMKPTAILVNTALGFLSLLSEFHLSTQVVCKRRIVSAFNRFTKQLLIFHFARLIQTGADIERTVSYVQLKLIKHEFPCPVV